MMRYTMSLLFLGLSLSCIPAYAEDNGPASDATTPIDARVGNLDQQPDNTLSTAEVKRLHGDATTGTMAPMGETAPQEPIGKPLMPAQPLDNHGNSQ